MISLAMIKIMNYGKIYLDSGDNNLAHWFGSVELESHFGMIVITHNPSRKSFNCWLLGYSSLGKKG